MNKYQRFWNVILNIDETNLTRTCRKAMKGKERN